MKKVIRSRGYSVVLLFHICWCVCKLNCGTVFAVQFILRFGCYCVKKNRAKDADRPENMLCACFHVDASFACSVNIYEEKRKKRKRKKRIFFLLSIELEFLRA